MRKEDTVKLISAEGCEFIIHRRAALVSSTLKDMLTSPGDFTENELGEVRFPEISTRVLEKLVPTMHGVDGLWTALFMMNLGLFFDSSSGTETEFQIEPELTSELMMAANYLHT